MELRDRRRSTAWVVTLIVYVASVVASTAFVHSVPGQPARFLGGLGLLVLGPAVVALVVGGPPVPVVLALVPIYYVVVALSSNGYDESRWSYSRITVGAFDLAFQLTAAAATVLARYTWLHAQSRDSN